MSKQKPHDFKVWLRRLWLLAISGPLAFVIMMMLTWAGVFGSLPSMEAIANPKNYLASQILSADGKQIGTFFMENRVHADYSDLPEHLVQALIATEDERFRSHSGIDFRALARAVVNMGRNGGGSTITQQMAKQMFHGVAHTGNLQRITQKLKEWIIAIQLEQRYSKDEIIALYFNKFDFLYQGVGVANASKIYFSKDVSDLNVLESAVLVGMFKNPSLYNPARAKYADRVLQRRNTVIRQMQRNDYLSQSEADSLVTMPIALRFNRQGHDQGMAPYLREHVRSEMKLWASSHRKPDGSKYNIYTDGLVIYTSIDSRMQRAAESAMTAHMSNLQKVFFKQVNSRRAGPFHFPKADAVVEGKKLLKAGMRQTQRYRNLKQSGASNAAIEKAFSTAIPMKLFSWSGDIDTVISPMDSIQYYKSIYQTGVLSVEPQTGFIKAWVGGIDFRHFQYDHVIQGRRQVGSTFKPFVYAAAISEKKYSPCLEIPNVQTCIEKGQFGLLEDWCPSNSDDVYGGVLTLKEALAGSVNSVTAYLMKQVGPKPVISMAKSLGVKSAIPEVPSIALGAVDLSVYEMVGAYTAFGNKGLYTEPIVMLRIEDKDGVVLDEFVPETREVFSPEIAYTMVQLLEGVTNKGTGRRLRHSGGRYLNDIVTGYPYGFTNDIAGKTGTTQNQSDGWFIGMVPNLITGIWSGCQDRAAHFGSTYYGQGATVALPIWGLYMRSLYEMPELGISKEPFERPQNMSINVDCDAVDVQAGGNFNDDDEFN